MLAGGGGGGLFLRRDRVGRVQMVMEEPATVGRGAAEARSEDSDRDRPETSVA